MSYQKKPKGFATNAIHYGQEPEQWAHMNIAPAIVMSSTYKQIEPNVYNGHDYGRTSNPTRTVLEKSIAKLDNGKYALAFATGQGATTTISHLLKSGDHIVTSDDQYHGSSTIFNTLSQFNVDVSYVDMTDLSKYEQAIKPNTRMVWMETPTNPLLKIIDIKAIAAIARSFEDIIVVVDNTFMTSYLQRPLDLGADIVMYSLTKFMNGHSDVIMGAAVTNRDDLHTRLRQLQNHFGIVPSPFDCYQVNRSLKTLAVRMKQHGESALAIAQFLETHPAVEKINYPGLPAHPQYELSLRQMCGPCGVMSFYVRGGFEATKKFLKALKFVYLAESLGGFESVMKLPAVMPKKHRESPGITENLVRFSVGLEDVDDLIEDLDSALRISQKK